MEISNSDASASKKLACPLCGGRQFKKETTRLESRHGAKWFLANMYICGKCSNILWINCYTDNYWEIDAAETEE